MKKFKILKDVEVTREEYVDKQLKRIRLYDDDRVKETKRHLRALAKINQTQDRIRKDIREAIGGDLQESDNVGY